MVSRGNRSPIYPSCFFTSRIEKCVATTNHVILTVHHLCTSILLIIDHIRSKIDETAWDAFLPTYTLILDHATQCLAIPDTATISLDSGIIIPLYMVASRCRDLVQRKRAIALLESRYWQEGVMSSVLAAKVAARYVQIEEEGRGEKGELPNEARLAELDVRFEPGRRRAQIKYIRWKPYWDPNGGEAVEEWLHW